MTHDASIPGTDDASWDFCCARRTQVTLMKLGAAIRMQHQLRRTPTLRTALPGVAALCLALSALAAPAPNPQPGFPPSPLRCRSENRESHVLLAGAAGRSVNDMKATQLITPLTLILFAAGLLTGHSHANDIWPVFPKNARILFQGDSITDGNRGRTPDPNHSLGHGYQFIIFPEFAGHFPELNLTFINRGVSGNKVSDLAARWQKDTSDVHPDVLSVQIGVNDVGAGMRATNRVSAERFESDYDSVLAQARAANPQLKLMLCEPFILPGWDGNNPILRIFPGPGEELERSKAGILRSVRMTFGRGKRCRSA